MPRGPQSMETMEPIKFVDPPVFEVIPASVKKKKGQFFSYHNNNFSLFTSSFLVSMNDQVKWMLIKTN